MHDTVIYRFAPACFCYDSEERKQGAGELLSWFTWNLGRFGAGVLFLYRVGITAMPCKGKGYFNMSDPWVLFCCCLSCLSDPWLIPIRAIYAQVGTFALSMSARSVCLAYTSTCIGIAAWKQRRRAIWYGTQGGPNVVNFNKKLRLVTCVCLATTIPSPKRRTQRRKKRGIQYSTFFNIIQY